MNGISEYRCSVTGEKYEPNSFSDAVHSFIAADTPEEIKKALTRLFETPSVFFQWFSGLLNELEIHTLEAMDKDPWISALNRFQEKWLQVAIILLNNQFPSEARILLLHLYQLVRTQEINRQERFHKGSILAWLGRTNHDLEVIDHARNHFLLAMIEDIRNNISGWRKEPARNRLVDELQIDAVTIDGMGQIAQNLFEQNPWDSREPELAWLYLKPQRRRISRAPLEFTKSIASEFLNKIYQAVPTTKEQGDSLELFISYIFAAESGFEVLGSTRTLYSQNDILIRNRHEDGAIASLGDYLIVECKNWNNKIDAPVVRDFASKLRSVKVKCGIIASKEEVTGIKRRGVGAREVINREYLLDSTAILILNETHFTDLVAGKLKLSTALLEQFENVRFDIR